MALSVALYDELITGEMNLGLEYEFWPALAPEGSRRILFVLHGRGDRPESFHFLPGALGLDDFNYLFLRAPDEYGIGFSWYDIPPGQGPGVIRSRRLLFQMLQRLQDRFHVPSTSFYFFGFSQGCLLILDLLLRYPDVLGGGVGSSGYVFFEEEYPAALSPVATYQKIMVNHGRQDEMLSLGPTRKSIEKLRGLGVHIDFREYDKAHTILEGEEIDDVRGFFEKLFEIS